MEDDDATDAEADFINDILSGDGVERVRSFVRQQAAQVQGPALTESLWRTEVARAYSEYEDDVFSDPDLDKLALAEFNRLKEAKPDLPIDGVLDRVVAAVIRKHGSADSRAIRAMARQRSLGTRGQSNL